MAWGKFTFRVFELMGLLELVVVVWGQGWIPQWPLEGDGGTGHVHIKIQKDTMRYKKVLSEQRVTQQYAGALRMSCSYVHFKGILQMGFFVLSFCLLS